MLVQLAFSPQSVRYEEESAAARNFLQELGVREIRETSEGLGAIRFVETMERLAMTEAQGNQWLSEFEKLLEDTQSREILKARVALYFQPNQRNVKKLVAQASMNCRYIVENVAYIDDFPYRAGTPIVFYGLGGFAERFIDGIQKDMEEICPEVASATFMYCDRNYKNIGKFRNETVISPEKLIEKYKSSNVIICTECYVKEIFQYLISEGFPQENIFFRTAVDEETQYFDTELIQLEQGEVFVDVGVLNAETSVRFSKKVDYEAIYLFEPSEEAREIAIGNLKSGNISSYELFPFGLWNEETVLEFSGTGGAFGITENRVHNDAVKSIQIPMGTMDKALENKYISFIKMDIEGAEMKALQGAEHLIKTHKPKLAISLYHKSDDLFDIPRFIHDIVPEYSFYLRHYSTEVHETVLYAVIPD